MPLYIVQKSSSKLKQDDATNVSGAEVACRRVVAAHHHRRKHKLIACHSDTRHLACLVGTPGTFFTAEEKASKNCDVPERERYGFNAPTTGRCLPSTIDDGNDVFRDTVQLVTIMLPERRRCLLGEARGGGYCGASAESSRIIGI